MQANITLPTTSLSGNALRRIDLVVIHCAASPSGRRISQGTPGSPTFMDAARIIDVWHRARGFKRSAPVVRAFNSLLTSIGYHWVVDIDGTILAGRHPAEVGAHAQGFNTRSLGICLVGGAEPVARYTQAQWDALAALVQAVSTTYKVPLAPPTRIYSGPGTYTESNGICGHRDLSPDADGSGLIEPFEYIKTCPGFDVSHWLKNGLAPAPQNIF